MGYHEFEEFTISDVYFVSELRHYVNCFGIDKDLLKKFKTSHQIIDEIYDNCFGSDLVEDLVKDSKYRKDRINEREKVLSTKQDTIKNHQINIQNLKKHRTDFCGVGTNKTKRLLNKLSKTSELAKAYRKMLEIEDKNITAKDTDFRYKDKVYYQKHMFILEMIEIFKENNWTFGYQNSDVRNINHIIYFELPDCEQISFHCTLEDEVLKTIPTYNKEWDGKKNSTLNKLENSIKKLFFLNQ